MEFCVNEEEAADLGKTICESSSQLYLSAPVRFSALFARNSDKLWDREKYLKNYSHQECLR